MNFYNEELEKLREQIDRRDHLTKLLENLKLQQSQLKHKVADLEKVKIKEQTDVDKLEGQSLAALFYAIRGKKEEFLESERKEAYMAAVKFDTASKELRAVEEDIADCTEKLKEISDCENRYIGLLSEKAEIIKEMNPTAADEILNLEENIASLKKHEKELNEAIEVGKRAKNMAESILKQLGKADDWSTWDIFGGGLIADIAKHDHLDTAQDQIETLQIVLREFQTELSDVKINANIKVNIDGFLGFADFFFDGLFADLTVKDKIEDSLIAVQSVSSQINSVMYKLENDLESTKRKQSSTQKQLDELILKA